MLYIYEIYIYLVKIYIVQLNLFRLCKIQTIKKNDLTTAIDITYCKPTFIHDDFIWNLVRGDLCSGPSCIQIGVVIITIRQGLACDKKYFATMMLSQT